MYREFIVPSDEEVADVTSVWPEIDDETGARVLGWEHAGGERTTVSYDPLGRSVRVRLWKEGAAKVDVFREGATRMALIPGPGGASLTFEFETGELKGRLTVTAEPEFSMTDQLLYT